LALVEGEATSFDPAHSEVISDSNASSGKALKIRGNYSATQTLNVPGQLQIVSVRLRGELCGSGPSADIYLDNKKIRNVAVKTTSYVTTDTTVNVPAGNHTVRIAFINDRYTSSCDRNLILDKIEFLGTTASSPTPSATPKASPSPTPTPFAPATPGTSTRKPNIPIGMYNVNNQVLNSRNYVYALRFVLPQDTTVHRFLSGFNVEGAGVCCRTGYGKGDGGYVNARLVTVNANGTPNLNNVLAQERVKAVDRYNQSKTAYGISGLTQMLYFNLNGVQLKGGTMYAMVYQNDASDPANNFVSTNSPTVRESVSGPNGRNNLDPAAPGAIAGLDPREAVAWSQDGGQNWVWGRRVGEGPTSGAYGGSATSDDGTRLPWYGWQAVSGGTTYSNQPYYAYTATGNFTVTVTNAHRAVTLTEAGGYAPVGANLGEVTVTNLSTGKQAKTASLGSGIVKGTLSSPVDVAPGQTIQLKHTGTVVKQEADSFLRTIFGLGNGFWSVTTAGHDADFAQLFVLPWPMY
jgi:hypothetical protein